MKVLTIYYSYSHGNTKKIAEELQRAIGGDMERLEPVTPYGGYEDTVRIGQEEVQRGYKPPIQPVSHAVSNYDVIALGTPTWWYTMAPVMKSFLLSQNFQGKKVILFSTHGGWPGSAIKHMKGTVSGATILGTMEVQFDSNGGDQQVTPQKDVDLWLATMKQKVE